MQISANEFIGVRDIKGRYLIRTDGWILGYTRVYPCNIDLLSRAEKAAKIKNLVANMQKEKDSFSYMTFPREIDLDMHKRFLREAYTTELVSAGRKRIIAEMLKECNELATSGENYEHQHFLKFWGKVEGEQKNTERELDQRMESFVTWYQQVGIRLEVLEEPEIMKLCNLFSNPLLAAFTSLPDEENLFPEIEGL